MPVIETDLLKAYLDPDDRLHEASLKAFDSLTRTNGYALSSASLIELDLLLKSAGFSADEREAVFHTLTIRLFRANIIAISPRALTNAVVLQGKYRIPRFYFDSLHLGLAMCHDGKIISSDQEFDRVEEVERIDPAEL